MYIITLEINQICNFCCKYCYLGTLSKKEMSFEIAKNALEIAFLNAKRHSDHRVWVDFVGGETLLSFKFIERLCQWIENEIEVNHLEVSYSITTNGSIMNKEILNWLIRRKVQVKISIDGWKDIHDQNRKDSAGMGTFDLVYENLPLFYEYQNRTGIRMQATHVVTKNNYDKLFTVVQYLVEKLRMEIIDSALDLSADWDKKALDFIANEWKKIIKYIKYRESIGRPFIWGPLIDMYNYEAACKSCGVGLIRIYVRADGSIYGCSANLNESECLGNVKYGLVRKKIQECKKSLLLNDMCANCSLNEYCLTKTCVMNFEKNTEGEKVPNAVMCYLEEKKQKLWREHYLK